MWSILPKMRTRRIKADPSAPSGFYHCISRVVDRRHIFGEEEKNRFVRLLQQLSVFCEVRVLSYCVMGNHFHLLIEVPCRPGSLPTDEELFRRLGAIYSNAAVVRLRRMLESLPEADRPSFRETFWRRMWDVSAFLKELKQRFTQWYNLQHARTGTLWEDRFKSILVEPGSLLIAVIAAYIDLNPVRASIVADPLHYRWNSYSVAVGGEQGAIAGYQRIQELVHGDSRDPVGALGWYRAWLYGRADARGLMTAGEVQEAINQNGRLDIRDAIKVRIRRLTYGVALGSRSFVEALLDVRRQVLGGRRPRTAQPMPFMDGDIFTLRRVRGPGIG